MKKILILNTGGTIGMTRTEKGYMPDREYFRKALINMDSLRAPGMPVWDLAETEELLDSSNMTVRDWNEIAKILADAYDSYDGFVVLHGTDTMAYTSSALSFMLEELDKPVILTGSQIPLCELRSDGRDNLISSMLIAAEGRVKEVCIYFGGKLLRGNRSIKYSADDLNSVGLYFDRSCVIPCHIRPQALHSWNTTALCLVIVLKCSHFLPMAFLHQKSTGFPMRHCFDFLSSTTIESKSS